LNLIQANKEKKININMNAQTILAKYPKKIMSGKNALTETLNANLKEFDFENYFKRIMDYVSIFF